METVMEEEEYNWREVKLHSLIPIVPEPELERETGERRRGRDILIAIDHGPNSKHAFDWTVTHLCRLADTLHLVHAVSSFRNEIVYEATQALMEKLAVEAFEVAMVKTVARIVEGNAGKVICKEAERQEESSRFCLQKRPGPSLLTENEGKEDVLEQRNNGEKHKMTYTRPNGGVASGLL
ncbi:hypothetical protein RND71_041807 [Anisodus tanguticus]|uniref:UspA domain-containing protein n=1 Tax=Anisodus tanguticus TaxID=243964 RepID=A0AAE1UX50_9SOLA|nr:hypothetical protein RND71_041807 [Anisodus tanguticus]